VTLGQCWGHKLCVVLSDTRTMLGTETMRSA